MAPRELPLVTRGRRLMVRVDQHGLELWLKGTRDKRRIAWRAIAGLEFNQVFSLEQVENYRKAVTS
jgi:hypothetical protein